jgi:hypothetical protein
MEWHKRAARIIPAVVCTILLNSCARFDPAWVPFSAASLAQDQIMLVRKEPPSFGFARLESQSQVYPDLLLFVHKRGIPDFLAETGDHDQHYLILYYLRARHAFACRTRQEHPGALEFAGPYPITAGEYRLLDAFRKGKFR